jgi:hypothetical protein
MGLAHNTPRNARPVQERMRWEERIRWAGGVVGLWCDYSSHFCSGRRFCPAPFYPRPTIEGAQGGSEEHWLRLCPLVPPQAEGFDPQLVLDPQRVLQAGDLLLSKRSPKG